MQLSLPDECVTPEVVAAEEVWTSVSSVPYPLQTKQSGLPAWAWGFCCWCARGYWAGLKSGLLCRSASQSCRGIFLTTASPDRFVGAGCQGAV